MTLLSQVCFVHLLDLRVLDSVHFVEVEEQLLREGLVEDSLDNDEPVKQTERRPILQCRWFQQELLELRRNHLKSASLFLKGVHTMASGFKFKDAPVDRQVVEAESGRNSVDALDHL